MNILLINHYAGSPILGMEYRPYYLAREWTSQGHQVMIVAASYSHLRREQPAVNASLTEEQKDGIRYLWLRTPAYQGNGIDRIINMLAFLWRLWGLRDKLARTFKPDVVIASSTYPLDIYPARAIARRAGARLIFEVHDLWPLSPMELGGMSRWHPFIMVMQAAENAAYRSSDTVVSILPAAKDHMVEHGMASDKFVHIPNGVDAGEWTDAGAQLPPGHEALFARLTQNRRFIICYAGSHGIANALDSLIEAADLMRHDPVSFVLVGQGPEKTSLEADTVRRGLENVFFLTPVPKTAVPKLLARADALFIGAQDQPLYRFGISMNKLMDYLMSGKPVVCAIRAANDIVTASGGGITVPPADPPAIAAALRGLMTQPQSERARMGLQGRAYIMKNHTYRELARRFEGILTGSAPSDHA